MAHGVKSFTLSSRQMENGAITKMESQQVFFHLYCGEPMKCVMFNLSTSLSEGTFKYNLTPRRWRGILAFV